MLKTSAYEDVTTYKMGRSIGKYVPYFVHAFLVEDTLIDTGTVFAGAEFLDALKGREIKQIINTHDHEDHTGNNHLIQKSMGPGSSPTVIPSPTSKIPAG